MKTEVFKAEDGKDISIKVWDGVAEPKGAVQLIHGMAEHVGRYDEFAHYLNGKGFVVYGDDHRAHGDTDINALGLAGEGDLFEKTVADERGITELIRSRHSLPVVLLGHSYGSFITQRYLTLGTDNIDGCILMGSAAMQGFTVNMGRKIAAKKLKKGLRDERGKFFAAQTFVKYNKRTGDGINGWLCRDRAEVGKYNTDPKCNFVCSNGFYYYFFGGLQRIATDGGENIRKDLPLLIISGGNDEVGKRGKLVKKLYDRYCSFGLKPRLELIEGARHEILNEIDKQRTYDLLAEFITGAVNK